tara:strand:- start:462 stop:1169 length:708 start_codon:yes stop_codon:yes gene_type:complete
MKQCRYCGKQYKQEKAYRKHELICQITRDDLNKISIIPSQKEMWILVQKLIIQNKEQQLKIEALERVVHRDIKKINMIDWLNTNIKKSTNFDTWLSKLYTTIDDLKYVFDSDIVRGLERVLINNIEKEKSPFKAFKHKSTILYIFNNSTWKKAIKDDLKKILRKIQFDILKRNDEYSRTMDKSKIFGSNNMNYLQNTQKILVTNPTLKERCYKNISKNIINIVKTELNMIRFNTL